MCWPCRPGRDLCCAFALQSSLAGHTPAARRRTRGIDGVWFPGHRDMSGTGCRFPCGFPAQACMGFSRASERSAGNAVHDPHHDEGGPAVPLAAGPGDLLGCRDVPAERGVCRYLGQAALCICPHPGTWIGCRRLLGRIMGIGHQCFCTCPVVDGFSCADYCWGTA